MRILIAEDDPVTRRLLQSCLERWGYEVILSNDGVQAWELLSREDPPEIAILDWMMPGLTGPEICVQLRQEDRGVYVYLILLTARADAADLVEGLDAGADDYLRKPFHPDELRARLRTGVRIIRLHRDLVETQKALEEQASRDFLTGVWNRRSILQILEKEVERTTRQPQALGVAMVDVDHFKSLNDRFGHQCGDYVLVQICRRLQACGRRYDNVGRYGGEEFLITLPGCNDTSVRSAAERLRASIAASPVVYRHLRIPMTISIGVTSLPAMSLLSSEDLIAAADEALYRAKREGRNRVVFQQALPRSRGIVPVSRDDSGRPSKLLEESSPPSARAESVVDNTSADGSSIPNSDREIELSSNDKYAVPADAERLAPSPCGDPLSPEQEFPSEPTGAEAPLPVPEPETA